jgi:hypothetical protein
VLAGPRVVDERLAAGRFEKRARHRVRLEKQPVVRDQRNEQLVDVEALAAEHAAAAHRTERREEFQAVSDEFG